MGGNILKWARAGAAATRGKPLPPWPFLIFFAVSDLSRWLQINNRKYRRAGRSSGRRGGVL